MPIAEWILAVLLSAVPTLFLQLENSPTIPNFLHVAQIFHRLDQRIHSDSLERRRDDVDVGIERPVRQWDRSSTGRHFCAIGSVSANVHFA